jgi:hypothetical protein
MSRIFHVDGASPQIGQVFVFGSNLSGIHGAGAARAACLQYGADWGVAEGITGQSYALPTVQKKIAGPLSLEEIKAAVDRFIGYAQAHPELEFFVTRVGCVRAGHQDADIAPMFRGAPENCSMPDTWAQYLEETP